MHEFHQEMLNEIRTKCLNYDLHHPIKRSSNVSFRNIFDPYCAEYKEHDHEGRAKILRQMMEDGIITSILVFYKMFMDLFAEKRPDIANAAPDAMAILLEHWLHPVVPRGTCQCCYGATCEIHDKQKYRVKSDAPDYLIGYGSDKEFVVIAKTYSKVRAYQIAGLLSQDITDDAVCVDVKKESDHIQSSDYLAKKRKG